MFLPQLPTRFPRHLVGKFNLSGTYIFFGIQTPIQSSKSRLSSRSKWLIFSSVFQATAIGKGKFLFVVEQPADWWKRAQNPVEWRYFSMMKEGFWSSQFNDVSSATSNAISSISWATTCRHLSKAISSRSKLLIFSSVFQATTIGKGKFLFVVEKPADWWKRAQNPVEWTFHWWKKDSGRHNLMMFLLPTRFPRHLVGKFNLSGTYIFFGIQTPIQSSKSRLSSRSKWLIFSSVFQATAIGKGKFLFVVEQPADWWKRAQNPVEWRYFSMMKEGFWSSQFNDVSSATSNAISKASRGQIQLVWHLHFLWDSNTNSVK